MKSAYELAMERLSKQSPTVKLTDAQRKQLAELDTLYKAKIAEREIFLKGEIDQAAAKGDPEAMAQLERQMSTDRRRFEQECEEKKDLVRKTK